MSGPVDDGTLDEIQQRVDDPIEQMKNPWHLSLKREQVAALLGEVRRYREAARAVARKLGELLDEHEPTGPTITGIPPACPSCRCYDPCVTRQYAESALAVLDSVLSAPNPKEHDQ